MIIFEIQVQEVVMPAKGVGLKIDSVAMGILAIVFGVLILVLPSILHWLVGAYLIVAGVLAIIGRR